MYNVHKQVGTQPGSRCNMQPSRIIADYHKN